MAEEAESCTNMAAPLDTIKLDNREYGEPFPGKGECCGTEQKNHMLQVPIAVARKNHIISVLVIPRQVHGSL